MVEPGACIGPVAVCRAERDTHDRSGLSGGEPPEIAELDDVGGGRLVRGEPVERLIEREQVVFGPAGRRARAGRGRGQRACARRRA